MKTKLMTTFMAVALIFCGSKTCSAGADDVDTAADIIVARPVCFVATIIGSAIFVVALPVAVTTGSVKETAHTLIGKPAEATFSRPIGDFSGMAD